jgi:hypothetical protein
MVVGPLSLNERGGGTREEKKPVPPPLTISGFVSSPILMADNKNSPALATKPACLTSTLR